MLALRIESAEAPFTEAEVARRLVAVVGRAEAMGLLEGVSLGTLHHLDRASLLTLVEQIREAGIGRAPIAELTPLLRTPTPAQADDLTRLLGALAEALENNPSPVHEWRRLVEVLGAEELAARVGVSASSLRRYQSGERETPDDVAARLHFLALVVGDLAGTYNDYGIRRWFQRHRNALDGRRPLDLLQGDWDPDSEDPRRVRVLAGALVGGPGAT